MKGKSELLQTLQYLKKSVSKIQQGSSAPDRPGNMTDSPTETSFDNEFKSCLKELKFLIVKIDEWPKPFVRPRSEAEREYQQFWVHQ